MMGLKGMLELPASVLAAVFTCASYATASLITAAPARPTGTGLESANGTRNGTNLPSTGSGLAYAKACWYEQMSFEQASSSWLSDHATTTTTFEVVGGTSTTIVTYYKNATTLCDGHPRVTYSPAISLSTGTKTIPNSGANNSTSTIVQTFYSGAYTEHASPTCTITATSDCDALYSMYSTSVAAGSPPAQTPPCLNATAAAQYSSATAYVHGCGDCTIYGSGVELVYFPTTKARDFCATTPTATLTHYGPSPVITAYAGKSTTTQGQVFDNRTVWADGHAFTTETAYISISTVYAVDRCSRTVGTPVKDAILAMPSESVLSLRYKQNHFQQVMKTDIQTGYPVDYADFNTPIPWSAWNGQNICDPGGSGGYMCNIIYENNFRPQLAIPPQITDLAPEFKSCQMWYGGLWDPPLALQPASSVVKPTAPGGGGAATTTAEATPSNKPQAPTASATAESTALPTSSSGGSTAPHDESNPSATTPQTTATKYVPANEPWQKEINIGGKTYTATAENGEVHVAGVTLNAGGSAQTLSDGTVVSYGQNGLVVQGSQTVHFEDSANDDQGGFSQPQSDGNTNNDQGGSSQPQGNGGAQNGNPTHTDAVASYIMSGTGLGTFNPGPSGEHSPNQNDGDEDAAVVTINGRPVTAVQTQEGGAVVVAASITITPGGSPATISGQVISAATDGVVVEYTSTVGQEQLTGSQSGHSSKPTGSAGSGDDDDSDNRSGSPTSHRASNGGTATTTGGTTLVTGSAASMSPAQALSLFAALLAVVVIGG